MSTIIDRLLVELRAARLSPTRVIHCVEGIKVLRWHVDDDYDRFVEVWGSSSSDVFCLARDRCEAMATVLPGNVDRVVTWVRSRLELLASRTQQDSRRATRRVT